MWGWIAAAVAAAVVCTGWIALRRGARYPEGPPTPDGEDPFMKNVRRTTRDFGSIPPPDDPDA